MLKSGFSATTGGIGAPSEHVRSRSDYNGCMSNAAPLNVPPVESPLLESWLESAGMSEADEALMREFAERGYLIFDLQLPDIDARAARIVANLASRYPDVERRILEAWCFDDDVRSLAIDERVMHLLRTLYQREPIPFQTLNFDTGTEQAAHSDTLHFSCAPRRYMAGVWIALEDIDANAGPLVVYPGSHKLPELDMFDLGLPSDRGAYGAYERAVAAILRQSRIQPEEVLLRKGQAIVWSANLFHGAAKIREPGRTRHSQATHYYFKDCLYYFPLESDPFVRRMCMREVIDIRTGRSVPNSYRGRVLSMSDYRQYMTYPRPLPAWVDAETPPADAVDSTVTVGSDTAGADGARGLRAEIGSMRETIAFLREVIGLLRGTIGDQRDTAADLREVIGLLHGTIGDQRDTAADFRDVVDELSEVNQALRADNHALRQENAKQIAKVHELEAMLHRLWESRSFRFVHGIAKTLRIDHG
jgi:hypothetical protein